jgi:hypothetical protein
MRDGVHLGLLGRLHGRLHSSLRWRVEVPLPMPGDHRAWDAEIVGDRPRPWRARVEAETRVADVQGLERRLSLKVRDDPGGHLILLLSDTRTNRLALDALASGLSALTPLSARRLLQGLAEGRDPEGGGILVL